MSEQEEPKPRHSSFAAISDKISIRKSIWIDQILARPAPELPNSLSESHDVEEGERNLPDQFPASQPHTSDVDRTLPEFEEESSAPIRK